MNFFAILELLHSYTYDLIKVSTLSSSRMAVEVNFCLLRISAIGRTWKLLFLSVIRNGSHKYHCYFMGCRSFCIGIQSSVGGQIEVLLLQRKMS